jgi:hypothetical protein
MTTQTDDPIVREDAAEPAPPRPRRRPRIDWTVAWAVGTWAIGTVVAEIVLHKSHLTGYGVRGWAAPLGYGFAGCAAILVVFAVLRRAPEWLAGASAGFFGSWVTMVLGTAIAGTPFPFQGLIGDSARLTAMATRYSVTWTSTDAFIPGLPSEYPPLFPWLVGRTSVLIGTDAWRLVGTFETLFMGVAILGGFLLWRRLVPAWVAMVTTVLGFATFAIPNKSYEVLTVILFVPWVLGTFGRPARGRLHWLTAGIVGGLIIQTYYGWLVLGGFGVLAIAYMTWRAETDRKAFLLHLVKVGVTAVVVAAWYIVPLVYGAATIGGKNVADLYGSSNLLDLLFPFLAGTPIAWLELIGLVGLVFLTRSTWWATPMLALVAGAYLYRVVALAGFAASQHSLLGQYTPNLYCAVLAMAGVLTLVEAVPKLLDRLRVAAPKGGVVIALSVALSFVAYSFTMDWMPNIGGRYSDYTERAYLEPLPDGSHLINKPASQYTPWFPVTPIQQDVEKVLGPNPSAVILSADERLFSFLPWHGYTYNDMGGTTAHWFERLAEIRKLEATHDPGEFASASAHTAYGPIDVFVLLKKDGTWQWDGHVGFNQPEAIIKFQPTQFDTATWIVDDNLPNDYVVAIRRP